MKSWKRSGINILSAVFLVLPMLSGSGFTQEIPDIPLDEIRAFIEADAAFGQGERLFDGGDAGKAAEKFRACLEIFPKHAKAAYRLALIEYDRREYTEAREHIQTAIAHYLGMYAYESSAIHKTKPDLEKKLAELAEKIARREKDLETAESHRLRIRSEIEDLKKQYYETTFELAETAVVKQSIPFEYFLASGDILMKLGEYRKARKEFIKALEHGASNEKVGIRMARVAARDNQADESHDFMEAAEIHGAETGELARQLFPESPESWRKRTPRQKARGIYVQIGGGPMFSRAGDYYLVVSQRYLYNREEEFRLGVYYGRSASSTRSPLFLGYKGEIGYQTDHFAVGVESGPFRRDYEERGYHHTYPGPWNFTLNVTPVVLNLKYEIIELSFLRTCLVGGVGLYMADFDSTLVWESNGTIVAQDLYSQNSWGFHLGGLAEITLSPNWIGFLDARVRIVNFNKMKGTTTFFKGTPDETVYEGDLLYHEHPEYGWENMVGFNPINSTSPLIPIREADFNLSGLDVTIGLKFIF